MSFSSDVFNQTCVVENCNLCPHCSNDGYDKAVAGCRPALSCSRNYVAVWDNLVLEPYNVSPVLGITCGSMDVSDLTPYVAANEYGYFAPKQFCV